jgi:putative tricarboxylic transport membrane protein
MKRAELREGLTWIGVGAAICVLSWRVDLGSFREPGAGFVSCLAGLSLVAMGVIMAFSARGAISSPSKPPSARSRLHRVFYTLGLLVGYGVALGTVGYLVTTFLLMLGLFYDRGRTPLARSALASLITVVSTYLLFETWLQVQLPRGILPWW